MSNGLVVVCWLLIVSCLSGCGQFSSSTNEDPSFISRGRVEEVQKKLFAKQDSTSRQRIRKGTNQLAANWRPEDGTPEEFSRFCLDYFLSSSELEANFHRIEQNLLLLQGNTGQIREEFTASNQYTDVPVLKVDPFFRKAIPQTDLYRGKLALFLQLNYPYYTLEEKRASASGWSREKWAMVRLGDRYAKRGRRSSGSDKAVDSFTRYMENYFLRMDHICMPDGSYPFPPGTFLHSHRGIRDDIKEQYTRTGGKQRQELSGKVLEHIIKGSIPDEFLRDEKTYWNPWSNLLFYYKDHQRVPLEFSPQGTKRYEGLLAAFHMRRREDSAYNSYMDAQPTARDSSTYLKRNFARQNMLADDVERLICEFLSAPILDSVARLIEKRLQRHLEPFDIWYSGFQEQAFYPADVLDSIVRTHYPNISAFQRDLPNILHKIGFPLREAQSLGTRIRVRPVTSGGYAKRPAFPGDTVIMTTMIAPEGMDYKAYRVAMHELGHAVEMQYTGIGVDNFFLADVPSNGITEGVAELFAYRNINGLGLTAGDPESRPHIQALATLWYLVEMGGQALTDIHTWKWLYAHPSATPADLKAAVLRISSDVWNKYYASIFGIRDQHILSIYNHFICGELYLYNYFISNVVMFQLYAAFGNDISGGLKRACMEGNTLPDRWMQQAVGAPVSLQPLLEASEQALEYFRLRDKQF